MVEKPSGSQLKTIVIVIFCLGCFFLLAFYYVDDIRLIQYSKIITQYTETVPGFIVSNPYCQIVDLDPFNVEARKFHKPKNYTSCSKLKLLTYVTKEDNIATVHVDNELIPSYAKDGISCCCSNVTRQCHKTHPDDCIKVSKCVPFKDNITFPTDVVIIKCENAITKAKVYENAHTAVTITDTVRKKLHDKRANTTKITPISVLFVGIDSISRLSLIRSLPETYSFLEENNWVPLKGYNKIADNTFPNLMGIFTGMNESSAYKICNPKVIGKLDNCSFIWKSYSKNGYVTGYAEDESFINTFNYNKKGFVKPATDYYFRPYILASEKLKQKRIDGMAYCTGPETSGERILNVIRDFVKTLKAYAYFGFFWMNTFSHNEINSPSRMDYKLREFLEDLTDSGVTNKSIVIFFSDHGVRFGNIRYTRTGWLEERMPFIYFSLPPWFKKKFHKEHQAFLSNVNKLTTPYDLYMTLQHMLVLSGFKHEIKPSNACSKCKSLLGSIEFLRSCEDAAILQHWCTCAGFNPVNATGEIVQAAAKYMLGQIQKVIHSKKSDKYCAKYSVSRVLSSNISQKFVYKNDSYLLIVLETNPDAVFEATIALNSTNKDEFLLSGDISRLDAYSYHSRCVKDAYLKKYCYCH